MRSSHHSPSARARRRLAAGAVAGTMLLAACGGGSDDGATGAQAGEPLPEASDAEAPAEPAEAPAPAATGAGFVDLVGPDVLPASDFAENLLPSVVVDDLTNGRKVNFRNLVPQDKPILLWMYAPH